MSSAIQHLQAALEHPDAVLLEGLHAIKHALRFGAELEVLVTSQASEVAAIARQLAPDVAAALAGAQAVTDGQLRAVLPRPPRPAIAAVACHARPTMPELLRAHPDRPVVLLEDPRRLGNVGACVRVAAGAGAGGVLTTGSADPWHADALRGAAGLHFALPVARVPPDTALAEAARASGRPIVALDPEGEPLRPGAIAGNEVLAFGTERDGLSHELLAAADVRVSLPMEPGVSSLNLATSVAATLYAWRLARPGA